MKYRPLARMKRFSPDMASKEKRKAGCISTRRMTLSGHPLRCFIDKEINPHMDEWEETTVPLHDLFKKMGDLGFLGIRYDPKYGGQGLDYWFETVLLEEIGHIKGMGVSSPSRSRPTWPHRPSPPSAAST